MSKREDIENMAEELLLPIITEHKFELVDVEYVKEAANYYLRAYIDKPGGITIDDCEIVSRALSDLMDTKDFISEAYILEVSSPGLGRPLKKEKDFLRSMGEEVEVKTYSMKEVEGLKRKQKEFTGILTNYENERVTIKTEEQIEITFEKSEISLIRLAFDF
jgi:ribosome maturation factor RimP